MGKGCKYHQDCLTCPFESCVEDRENRPSPPVSMGRMARAAELYARGMSPQEVAHSLGISLRSAYRYLPWAAKRQLTT